LSVAPAPVGIRAAAGSSGEIPPSPHLMVPRPGRPANTTVGPDDHSDDHPENESTHVSRPGHTAVRVGEELGYEPEAEQPFGADVDEHDEKEEDGGSHGSVGEPDEVGAHHGGDRPRGAHHRN